MAFKLYKASGSRVPDIVSHIGAGATLGASASNIVSGKAVQISGGELELGATNTAVAGIIVADFGDTTYATGGSATFPDGVAQGTKIPFLPVTGTVPIEADVKASTVTIANGQPGDTLDLDTNGMQLTTNLNGDFRVVKALENDGTYVTKVAGFFVQPGYFTA